MLVQFFFNRENGTQSPSAGSAVEFPMWRTGRSQHTTNKKRYKPHTATTISHAEGGFLAGKCDSCWWWFPVLCCEVQMEAFPETAALWVLLGCPRYRRLLGLILQLAEWSAGVKASLFGECIMFCIGNGVSCERRSCRFSRLLMQRAAPPTHS